MGFLICNKTKEPKNCDGRIYRPTMNDLETLTQYFYEANNEMDGIENITMEVARNKAIENIESGNFYALKNCCPISAFNSKATAKKSLPLSPRGFALARQSCSPLKWAVPRAAAIF